jgi:competence protein ComEC
MIMYVLMAGAQAAVVRAGIMAGLTTFALYSGRKTDGIWIWIVTGLAMLIISPAYFEDVGWQLSMAATAGLLWSGKLTSEKLLLTDLRTTLAAQVTTLPIVLHHFGNVSVVAPLTNVLVLPVVPLVMQIVAGASLVGLLLDQLGMMISWLAYPLLRWMTLVTDFVGAWSWSSITVEKLGWGWVAGYYLLLVIISNYKFLIINKPR